MDGGKYLAIERGLYEESEPTEAEPAVAPLVETVTMHMDPEKLASFLRWYGDLP